MRQGESRRCSFLPFDPNHRIRLDYLTNVLGFDHAASKKLILQREKSQ